MEEFNIPENVESVATTFISSTKLARINVDSNNKYFKSLDGILFDKNITRLIKYPENRDGRSYEVPNTVKTIDANAFIACKNLEEITIADSVEKIGDSAFYASSLQKIYLGGGITNINNKPFYEAWNLTSINVAQAFFTSHIKNVIIPSSVKKIGNESFFACSNLEEVNIPEGLEQIGWSAFCRCHKIKTIVVPSSVTFIGGGAFNNMGRIN